MSSAAAVPNASQHPTLPDGTFQQAYKLGPLANLNIPGLADARVMKSRTLESLFDEIMDSVQCLPVSQAIENSLQPVFEATNIYLWIIDDEKNILFAPTLSKIIQNEGSALLTAAARNQVITTDDQSKYLNFNESIDAEIIDSRAALLYIPVNAKDGSIRAIIQIARAHDFPFFDQDRAIADYLVQKFQKYSSYIFNDKNFYTDALQLITPDPLPETMKKVSTQLCEYFKAKKIEFWQKKSNNVYIVFTEDKCDPIPVNENKIGAVYSCLNDFYVINERQIKNNRLYTESVDGPPDDPALFIPYNGENGIVWAIALRGRHNPPYYTKSDESSLLAFAPFALKSIEANLFSFGSTQYHSLEERLTTLLDVAETLTGVLDIDNLIPTIMERACILLNASRCSLFIVDKTKQQLVTFFHGGLKEALHIPLSRGIVGYTANTGKIVNIKDAYSDQRFDRTIDKTTGFKTTSLLTVPIFNNRGEITGVTEMMNKIDGKAFDEDDVRMLMAFNVFCGTSLDNAKLYKASLDLTRQLRTFMEMSSALNTASGLNDVLKGILENARSIVSASNAILYSYDTNDNSISKLVTVGEESPTDYTYAQECINAREPKLFTKESMNKMKSNTDLSSAIENILASSDTHNTMHSNSGYENQRGNKLSNKKSKSGNAARASTVLTSDSNINISSNSSVSEALKESFNITICCIPLMNSEQTILGVMELSCRWKIVTEDLRLLDCFAVFAAVSLERNLLKEIAVKGKTEIDLEQWILPQERDTSDKMPMKFVLPKSQLKKLWTIYFDAPAWDGIGHIRVIFNIFYKFKLLQEFNVSNEKFFRFLSEIRDTYKKVPYHNWRHAVDVTQFVTYQILVSNFDKELTKFELYGILVSAVCHDANHDGFTNVYNVKAETPLGILFKNQSVMETHHCSISIDVISKEECNIFEYFTGDDYRKMWSLVINLILATDMARHFDLLKQFNALKDEDTFSMENPEHRLLIMQLVLKCGDVSNVSRPFELADKWCDVLCEEFFRQGDLEMANGMEYTSPLNDRAHLDKPKSQIGFYTFVCLPLYQTTARGIPELKCNVEQVQSNLEKWKAATAAAEAEQK
ncbi:3'5'-cyclic nucleotide phosphodiesterase family protein [Tritrichomonas foetus]|uniref:3'5'-cyclic nucleotide phosphodiesterase family protein n=1 Tax=Tritrichomonas foetus TaxID=1144522 RepID=A0A1J4JED0_9EUKA|nr:3'5'-cyclic nucleotide phosphodiesterase family protein [Tritrichomonas foetus]|eukprot:OHS96011.1 3'5'-cyclic nucleotide phosphodiesterase family protein [Tritrichomonas foetus]